MKGAKSTVSQSSEGPSRINALKSRLSAIIPSESESVAKIAYSEYQQAEVQRKRDALERQVAYAARLKEVKQTMQKAFDVHS